MTRLGRVGAACAVLILGGGCMMQNQSAPALTGPSGFALSLVMTANPSSLARDGSSQSVITVTARDAENKPVANKTLGLSKTSGTLSVGQVTTDANGAASFTFIAPGVNEPVDAATITATPVDEPNAANAVPRTVRIGLIGPDVPVASFTMNPAVPGPGDSVTFDASGSTLRGTPCGAACSYTWDFGGSGATGQLALFTFTTAGVKTVSLTVTAGAASGSTSKTFVVALPAAPTADFTVSPASPIVNSSAIFTATNVGVGAVYVWDFGDGSGPTAPSSVAVASHTYTTVGSKIVTLVVTDSVGRTATVSKGVSVTIPTAPTAAFTVTPSSPTAGSQAVFNGSTSTVGSGATIVSYSWDFGDASTTTTAVPSVAKTYALAGVYTASLTVTDSFGRTATASAPVTVK